MRNFVDFKCVSNAPYHRLEYSLLPLPDARDNFIQEAAKFFIESWMDDEMRDVWLNWDNVPQEEKGFYSAHWEHLRSEGILIDDPSRLSSHPGSRHTAPIGAFSETMLRWLRASFDPIPLLVEPSKAKPTEDGKIDFIEITGCRGDYASFKVTLWEVKSSDGQISSHNSNVYQQIDDYHLRFLSAASCLSEDYTGDDMAFKMFLSKMGKMAWRKHPSVHYGVFVTYNPDVKQDRNMTPSLHKHPKDHPSISKEICHHLVLLLIPGFRDLRLEVWRSLHLI